MSEQPTESDKIFYEFVDRFVDIQEDGDLHHYSIKIYQDGIEIEGRIEGYIRKNVNADD